MAEIPENPVAGSDRPVEANPGRPFSPPAQARSAAEDERLLERVRARDAQAMAELFDRYGSMVYSVALRVLRDTGHAEDVMQDVFFNLWENPKSFVSARGSLGAWLLVVARNRSIDALRRRKPSDSVDEVVLPAKTNLAEEAERNTIMEKVRGVMNGLPPDQQKSLQMAFFEGLSHSEIAAKTGDPLGTVKTRIRTALISVRKAIQA
jgi:RNA polymerase sigma-70 factor (ECF subfamily)